MKLNIYVSLIKILEAQTSASESQFDGSEQARPNVIGVLRRQQLQILKVISVTEQTLPYQNPIFRLDATYKMASGLLRLWLDVSAVFKISQCVFAFLPQLRF